MFWLLLALCFFLFRQSLEVPRRVCLALYADKYLCFESHQLCQFSSCTAASTAACCRVWLFVSLLLLLFSSVDCDEFRLFLLANTRWDALCAGFVLFLCVARCCLDVRFFSSPFFCCCQQNAIHERLYYSLWLMTAAPSASSSLLIFLCVLE